MPLLRYTTRIGAAITVGQIQDILVKHGAKSIVMDYGDDGSILALSFDILTPHGFISIRLPVKPDAVEKILTREYKLGKVPKHFSERPHAVRVAWRIVKTWVEAQMALLETEMVEMEQLFLPYMIIPNGRTLFETMVNQHFLLESGDKDKKDGE